MNILYPEFLILLFGLLFFYLKNPKYSVLYGVLVLMIFALTRPVVVLEKRKHQAQGVEAVIALDLSYSMRAKDIAPSRLDAAKETIRKLLQRNRKNRYALYGFTSSALILSPPTQDSALLLSALDAVEVDNILTHGTSLETLLKQLKKKQFPIENLVIFSDGGEEKDLQKLLEIALEGSIKIVAVAMASRQGSMLYDGYGKVLKDADGALVITRVNPLLKALAVQSGGAYLAFKDPDTTAGEVAEALEKIAQKSHFTQRQRGYRELFWIPLLAALSLFFFHFVEIPGKWLALIPFLTLTSDASVLDWIHIRQAEQSFKASAYAQAEKEFAALSSPTLQSEFDRALAAYYMKRYKKAVSILSSLTTKDSVLKYKILFLQGNAYVRMKQYSKARRLYQQALMLQKDPDLLYNMKQILGKKDQTQPKPPVYQKKESDKAGFAAKKKRSHPKKEQRGKGKGARKKVSRPLGYKAYELINRGYIDEKKPW